MEELEYTMTMQLRTIEAQAKKVAEDVERLQRMIQKNDWHGYDSMCWLEGHVAQDVATMTALIARQRALTDALHMLKKASE